MVYTREQAKAQQVEALELANRIRLARGKVKKQIKVGEVSVVEALPLPEVQSMRLYDLLACQALWGDYKTRRFLERHGISEFRTVRDVTPRQVALIVADLE